MLSVEERAVSVHPNSMDRYVRCWHERDLRADITMSVEGGGAEVGGTRPKGRD